MNKTPNYQLNQWEADDRVQRVDFNADNAKIDAALGKKCEIACGTYTGDGAASRTISLSFAPKAVFVTTQDGITDEAGGTFGGLAVPGAPSVAVDGTTKRTVVAISGNGFQVFYLNQASAHNALSNIKGRVYHYFAIG